MRINTGYCLAIGPSLVGYHGNGIVVGTWVCSVLLT